jgi:hypothetical protein
MRCSSRSSRSARARGTFTKRAMRSPMRASPSSAACSNPRARTTPRSRRSRPQAGFGPTALWEANRERAERVARVAEALGMELVTFHAGFIPHDAGDPERDDDRSAAHRRGSSSRIAACGSALETGQETGRDARRPARCARPRVGGRELRPGEHDPVRHGRPDRGVPAAAAEGDAGAPQGRDGDRGHPARGARRSPSAGARWTGRRSARC